MRFEELPGSILALILNRYHSWAAIELWKCGNSLLMSRLANGGVIDMLLRDPRRKGRGVWPRCLKSFKLRSLSIYCRFGLGPADMIYEELRQLHSGIKRLEVSCLGVADAFFLPSDDSDFDRLMLPPSPKRAKLLNNESENTTNGDIWDLSLTHPELEYFCLGSEQSRCSPSIGEHIFRLLPRTLTHLDLSQMKPSSRFSSFHSLPKGLRTLLLPPGAIDCINLGTLPESLTYVGMNFSVDTQKMLALNPSLLPNLQRFPCPGFFRDSSNIDYLLRDGLMPSNMTTLSFSDIAENSDFSILPSNLTKLEVGFADPEFVFPSHWLQDILPSTLTELRLERCNWDEITSSSWPPNLKTFVLSSDPIFSVQHFHLLSRNLKSLSLNRTLDKRVNRVATVPDVEESSLLALGREMVSTTDAEIWRNAKQTMIKKVERSRLPFQRAKIEKYMEEVEKGCLLGMPLSLTTVTIGSFFIGTKCLNLLPPKLRWLSLETTVSMGRGNFWILLPPSLTRISHTTSLNPNEELSDFCSTVDGLPPPAQSAFFNSFITCLSLDLDHADGIPRFLSYLPRLIRSLDLRVAQTQFIAEDLKELPPNLISLKLRCESVTPAENWLYALPRTLKTLFLQGPEINARDLAQLPPEIESVSAIIVDATLDLVLMAPRSLRKIGTVTARNARFTGHIAGNAWNSLTEAFVPFWRLWHAPRFEIDEVLRRSNLNPPLF